MLAAAAMAAALVAHVPVVVHDADERHPLTSVAAAPVAVPGLDRDRRPAVYGRTVRAEGGGAWLQYWLFYSAQDQDRGLVRTGRHAGDWEMVQVRVDTAGRPDQVVFAQHSGAERCGWGTVERDGAHPVVYVANGSHASYPRPGTRDRTWPDPNDEADGRGVVVRPRLVVVDAARPAWMRWPEPWGGARAAWWNPAEQDSPRGPAFQGQGRWSDPDAWARAARPCAPACDRVGACDEIEKTLTAGVGGLIAGLAAFAWWCWRRPRYR